MDRREFAAFAATSLVGLAAHRAWASGSVRDGLAVPLHDMSDWPDDWTGNEQIVMLAYPGMTALDLVGPQYMFASLWGADVKVAAKTRDPIVSDTRLTIVPDISFDQAAADLDVIFVPGAISGALNAMEDDETMTFLADRGRTARYVTSVCTGSLLLGQAGLLDGYRATSHWLSLPLLGEFGAIPVDERVVRDRNRVTGGGVTAGIDFGLSLIAELRGETYAQAVQLLAEYAPEPPFNAGTLGTAPGAVVDLMTGMFAGFPEHVRAVAALRRRG